MTMVKLEKRRNRETNRRLTKAYTKMQNLIEAFNKKELPRELLSDFNYDIELINSVSGTDKELTKTLRKIYSKALKVVEEKMKYVAKHHYRNLWIAYGILAAVAFSSIFGSFVFTGIGSSIGMMIPMGMAIGAVIGSYFDQQAEKDGRQLDLVTE
jgi:hypothetical protein